MSISRSSRRVPGYSRSSSRNATIHSRNTKCQSRNGKPWHTTLQFGAQVSKALKKPGAWKNKRVCEMGPEGATRAPSPPKKVPDAARPRVLWQTERSRKHPRKWRNSIHRPDWAFAWESLLRGVSKTTRRVSETTPGPSRTRVAANATEKEKQKPQKRNTETPLPPRVQKKGLGTGKGRASPSPASSRRIQRTRRAQNGTPRKAPRKRTHGQNGR